MVGPPKGHFTDPVRRLWAVPQMTDWVDSAALARSPSLRAPPPDTSSPGLARVRRLTVFPQSFSSWSIRDRGRRGVRLHQALSACSSGDACFCRMRPPAPTHRPSGRRGVQKEQGNEEHRGRLREAEPNRHLGPHRMSPSPRSDIRRI